MTKSERARKREKRLIAAGLCIRCGRMPARPNRRACVDCAALMTIDKLARDSVRVLRGLCIYCGKQREGDRYQGCTACRVKVSAQVRARRKTKKEEING